MKLNDRDQIINFIVSNNNNSLKHHGVKGMKWGVITSIRESLGRRKKAKLDAKAAKKELKKASKRVKKLTNDELIEKTMRLELENNYINAVKANREKSIDKISKFVDTTAKLSENSYKILDVGYKFKNKSYKN